MNEIKLLSANNVGQIIKLNKTKQPYIVEDILRIHNKVYSDAEYEIEVDFGEDVSDVLVFLNEEFVNSVLHGNRISFNTENRCIFSEIIGFAQLSFCIKHDGNSEEWLYSDYISVLIQSTSANKSIDAMLKYVYMNQADILRVESKVTDIGADSDNTYEDFWSQIVLMEEIANVYESCYGYFMANCRYKLDQKEVLDSVDKLQYVDSKTIQFIVQHPEFLKRELTGIKYGRQTFQPSKTLMMQNLITYDIYENQVVVGFIKHVMRELISLKDSIQSYLDAIDFEPEVENGYIVSSHILYMNAKDVLQEFITKARELEKKYQNLVSSYSGILRVKSIPMYKQPEPTAIFLNLPEYNRIYMCIRRWFSKKGYNLVNEKVILNIGNAPAVYESYVLIKLVNQIKECGYELKESKCVLYPKQPNWKYRHNNYNNTFLFENYTSKLTLYYEPVIYDEDRSSVNGISLYRNNSISINRDSEDEMQGHYYVPDYVIKYEENGKERYIICDAKFSRKNKIKYSLMPDLTYKYITSISAMSESASIRGLYVFYALNEDNVRSSSFYDRQLRQGKKIEPIIEMIPFSEDISYFDQSSNVTEMLMSIFGVR